jgi:hypothetical protein
MAPYDITNDVVKLTVKDDFNSVVDFVTVTNGVGSHSDPSLGFTILVITKAQLEDAANAGTLRVLRHEIRRITSTPTETVFFAGPFEIHPTATPI